MVKHSSSLINSPLQLVIGPRGESGALDDLAHLLATEAEVVDGPHVRELHHFDLEEERRLTVWLGPCCLISRSGACVVISPVCNTSSRPQARWSFPQGEGDSGLLTLPAWQKVSGANGWGGGIRDFHSSVFSPDVHLHQCAPDGSSLPPRKRQWRWLNDQAGIQNPSLSSYFKNN